MMYYVTPNKEPDMQNNDTYLISTHHPIPAPKFFGQGRQPLYPLGALPVGGSFDVPLALRAKIEAAAANWKRRRPGWDYRVRRIDDIVRVWRAA